MEKLLSLVIVEYNSVNEIVQCVEAINNMLKMPHEVIVSSNSCYDLSQQSDIMKQCPEVVWQFNERNGGFAYAMNQGLKRAKGDSLVIMNSDCTLLTDLCSMVEFMAQYPEVGAAGPQLIDDKGNIQDTARPYVSVQRFLLRQLRRKLQHKVSILENHMNYSRVQTVDWVIGAFIMVSRRAYEHTGGLDEAYFMYAEDLDWCTRIRQEGLEVVYYPQAKIRYKGTRRARSNKKYAKIFIRSHIHYWRKFGFFFGYPKKKPLSEIL